MHDGLVKAGRFVLRSSSNHSAVREHPGWAPRRRHATLPVVGV